MPRHRLETVACAQHRARFSGCSDSARGLIAKALQYGLAGLAGRDRQRPDIVARRYSRLSLIR
jgi:hypothetical protein